MAVLQMSLYSIAAFYKWKFWRYETWFMAASKRSKGARGSGETRTSKIKIHGIPSIWWLQSQVNHEFDCSLGVKCGLSIMCPVIAQWYFTECWMREKLFHILYTLDISVLYGTELQIIVDWLMKWQPNELIIWWSMQCIKWLTDRPNC